MLLQATGFSQAFAAMATDAQALQILGGPKQPLGTVMWLHMIDIDGDDFQSSFETRLAKRRVPQLLHADVQPTSLGIPLMTDVGRARLPMFPLMLGTIAGRDESRAVRRTTKLGHQLAFMSACFRDARNTASL
jgi:hypothetical protein